MRGTTLTITFCLMASTALAQAPAAAAAGTGPQPQLIQASLGPGATATARTREPAAAQPAAVPDAAKAAEDEGSRAVPMLLAALALMAGIALRRRDPGAQ